MIAPIAGYMLWSATGLPTPDPSESHSTPEAIEAVISHMKFVPLLPPSRLRGPGAIYAVDDGSYWKVCDNPELVRDKIHSSPIPNQSRNKLEKAGFSMRGGIVDTLNASLGSSRIVSIEYRMSNVTMSEIVLSDLKVIERQLMNDRDCEDMVAELLKQNVKVCLGYAVVTASTSYRVKVDASVDTGGETHMPVIEAVKRQIELETKGDITLTGAHELVGQNLHYGIKLSPRCITPRAATVPILLDHAPDQPSGPVAPKPAPQPSA